MRILTFVTLCLAVLASGCAGSDGGAPAPAPAAGPSEAPAEAVPLEDGGGNATGLGVETAYFNGTFTGALGRGTVCISGSCVNAVEHPVRVTNATTALLVELRWPAPWDLDLWVRAGPGAPLTDPLGGQGPSYVASGGLPGAPDAPVRILVDDLDTLHAFTEWDVRVLGKASVQAPYEVAVSLFHGGAPPEGYTAFAPA